MIFAATYSRVFTLALIAASLVATGCNAGASVSNAAAPPPVPEVSVTTVHSEDTPIYSDYTAQTFARDMVEVRGRVDGYIEKRLFETGTDVKAGQPLYTLDLRPYEADVQKVRGELSQSEADKEFAANQVGLLQAEADLAQAQANLVKAQQDVARLQPLVKQEAAAQQDLDNALAALQANQASVRAKQASVEQARLSTKAQIETTAAHVESQKASLRSSELNLEYATIRAPISGRIGDSMVQVGGLVTRSSAQPLTTIVPLDVIWVRFKLSENEYFDYERRTKKEQSIPLQLVLADGQPYPHEGRIQNTVNQVDAKTGTIELQATFPNPERIVLPGQFGRVRMRTENRKNAILVPQKAVQDVQGLQSVLTVSADGKVLVRTIVTGERIGERWVVLQGLSAGERVIVEGIQKAMPGSVVTPREE
ncbi:MAG TPA: efflux RND transporter periplasmic adaptor subunit [Terriglobia bacterium]|nr:efflux RND transporter periplasmic adaptor subunit [Terriglobia bacterium]